MRRSSYVCFLLFSLFFLLVSLHSTSCGSKKLISENEFTEKQNPAPVPEEPAFITAIKTKVQGKEKIPAEEVFENLEILKGIPAGRVLPIMQMAFSQGLGVKCTHCHLFNDWASDEIPQKNITRKMWTMTGQINRELLPKIEGLTGPRPTVNCTTCHRGEVTPALRLDVGE